MTRAERMKLLRTGEGSGRVTNVELFFDLVYVFAITQLSHLLGQHTSVETAMQTAILLAMVWQSWVYTTWVTNWLDPNRLPTRAMLLGLMLAGLVLSAQLPHAFTTRGMVVAVAYAATQIGRSIFAVIALRGERLERNFVRILCWCTASGAVLVVGALSHGHMREAVFAAAIGADYLGGRVGFWTPGLGRSTTDEWTIEGSHFAERCEGFVIIALGESIVAIGSTLSGLDSVSAAQVITFVVAFLGTVGLWWVYFDRVADRGAEEISTAQDPGRIGATAYHLVHPVIVAGIVAAAAADQMVVLAPSRHPHPATSLLVVGGVALFLGGHAIFKAMVFRVVPVSRLVALAVLAVLLVLAPHVTALVLSAATLAVVGGVAAADRVQHPDTHEQGASAA